MNFVSKINMGSLPISQIPTRVNDVTEYFRALYEQLKDVRPGLITDELCDTGVDKAKELNAMSPKTGLVDNSIYKTPTENGVASIVMEGPNAVYDEFGTGEEGSNNPHPLKGQFNLNPYNSGPTIFYNELAGRYQWIYRPMAGRPYFTEEGLTSGTPSGKQMYNTLNYINSIKGEIISQHIEEMLKETIRK